MQLTSWDWSRGFPTRGIKLFGMNHSIAKRFGSQKTMYANVSSSCRLRARCKKVWTRRRSDSSMGIWTERENRVKSLGEQRAGQMQNFLSTRRRSDIAAPASCWRRPLLRRLDPEVLPQTEQGSFKRNGYPWVKWLIRYRLVLFCLIHKIY